MTIRPLVMLVEDEPLIRTVLTDALEDAGYLVLECDTGKKAIARLEAADIAVLVTDIRLGVGANGWDVARSARQRRPSTAVVYMTGDSASDWSSEGVPTSIILQKPFATAQIVTAVSNLLNAAAPS